MTEPVWVLFDVAVSVHKILIVDHGGLPGIRDNDLLDSALNRPRQSFSYNTEPSIAELAASYCFGIARNHPFVDGNKRSALTIAGIFLEINGYTLTAAEPDAVVIIEALAAGNISELDVAAWFCDNSVEKRA
jgi:death-on-curing protein